jgi:hypothetical protein
MLLELAALSEKAAQARTCNTQQTPCDMQQTPCNRRFATCNKERTCNKTPGSRHHATCNTQQAPCNMEQTVDMRQTTRRVCGARAARATAYAHTGRLHLCAAALPRSRASLLQVRAVPARDPGRLGTQRLRRRWNISRVPWSTLRTYTVPLQDPGRGGPFPVSLHCCHCALAMRTGASRPVGMGFTWSRLEHSGVKETVHRLGCAPLLRDE